MKDLTNILLSLSGLEDERFQSKEDLRSRIADILKNQKIKLSPPDLDRVVEIFWDL